MEIPNALVQEVKASRVALFFGSGASLDATLPNGRSPLSSNGLRDALIDRFLSSEFKDEPLDFVAELATNSSDLFTVQDYIKSLYDGIKPSEHHKLVAEFSWYGLATTNYDLLIETVYESERAAQRLVPFISDEDRVGDKLRSEQDLAYLKLHGCLTRTHNERLPLVLTKDQYSALPANRVLLFNRLEDWGSQRPIVFLGHSLQDFDLRAMLLRMSKKWKSRPRFYMVKPRVRRDERNLWEKKHVEILEGTMEDFLTALSQEIAPSQRQLSKAISTEHPIMRRFVVRDSMPPLVLDMLNNDAQYVHQSIEVEAGSAQRFYRGFDLGWYPIANNLDVPRNITEEILWETIGKDENLRPTNAELYVVKAEAGAGKTILLKRMAWTAATQSDALCLYSYPLSTPRLEALEELHRVVQARIFLFIDSASDNIPQIKGLLDGAQRNSLPLTIMTSVRTNAWNVSCTDLKNYATDEYSVPYLTDSEIRSLVTLLRENDAVGVGLKDASFEDQVDAFRERAGRQLLVALHEATSGRPFQELLYDEYQSIYPREARLLYRTICLLYKANVPVRAGLINRVHGISFEEFQDRFFGPLEHVVKTLFDKRTKDYAYAARHTEIAQIVFDRTLRNRDDRFNEYISVLKGLNVSFASDEDSFRKLINARALEDAFPQRDDVDQIFKEAEHDIGENAYLYQQMANYERRINRDYARAYSLLDKARSLSPRDTSIVHTMAELARTRAKHETRPMEKSKLRRDARTLLAGLLDNPRSAQYARGTYIGLLVEEHDELVASEQPRNGYIDGLVREIERAIQVGRQQFPDDTYIRRMEAQFARSLKDHERSQRALASAFSTNPRDADIATRLARIHELNGELAESQRILRLALEANPHNKHVNFRFAEVLRKTDGYDLEQLIYYFRRAFVEEDANFEAQFWYARFLYETLDMDRMREAETIFYRIRQKAPIHYKIRNRIKDSIKAGDQNRQFDGSIQKIDVRTGLISMDGTGASLFFHENGLAVDSMRSLHVGQRVQFQIGFSFAGPRGLQVTPA